MKTIVILFLTIICFQPSSAQVGTLFYIVNDPDGWVNVRDNNKVIDKLNNNTLVVVFGDQEYMGADWFEVQYNRNNDIKYGYIHKSRLKSINKLDEIPIIEATKESCTFSNGSIYVKITEEPFGLTNRTLQYSSEGAWLEYIDGKYIWGVDGSIPKRQYKSIETIQNGNQIKIPTKALNNLFEPTLEDDYTGVYYNSKTNTIYIVALNGDGAGGYLVGWTIKNGEYKERLVTHGF